MATRTDSQAWRSILGLFIPAAVLGTVLGLLQAGVFDGQTPSPVSNRQDIERTSAAPSVKVGRPGPDALAMTVEDDLRLQVQTATQEVPPVAEADELTEEAALQQALAQEQANGG